MINIVCTSKPGDGLLRYSYEHNCALNSKGIKSQLIIIPNPKHTKEEYIKSIKDQYRKYENIVFDNCTPNSDDLTLVLGRSMITLAYKDIKNYTNIQKLTLHLLFDIIGLYSSVIIYILCNKTKINQRIKYITLKKHKKEMATI